MSSRRYSEDEFRAAVADPEVRTIADLCRALGIVPRGANYETVRAYAAELGIALSRLEPPPTHRGLVERVPETDLRRAVTENTSLASTLRSLALSDVAAATSALRARLETLGIDTSHFTSWRPAGGISRHTYTGEDLRAALEDPEVRGYPALCERLDLQPLSNTYRRLRARASLIGLEIPAEWSKRGPRPTLEPFDEVETIRAAASKARSLADILRAIGANVDSSNYERLHLTLERYDIDVSDMPPPEQRGRRSPKPLSAILVKGGRATSSDLRKRLIEAGIKKRRCELCGRAMWRGRPIPLELDHIDGDRWNNELENLRLVCPNCHALTPTYRGRNIGRANGSPATEAE